MTRKKIILAALAGLLLLTLAACGSKLPEGFDEGLVTDAAKNVVELANAGDYDGIVGLVREDLRSQIAAETLETGWGPLLEDAGAFVDYKKMVFGSSQGYAVAVAACEYENATRTYTLSFDENYDLAGLYLK